MCFRCSVCKKSVPPRTGCKRIVRTRIHHHPYRSKVQRKWGYDKTGKLKLEWTDDRGGTGTQIVSEHPVCPECAAIRGI